MTEFAQFIACVFALILGIGVGMLAGRFLAGRRARRETLRRMRAPLPTRPYDLDRD